MSDALVLVVGGTGMLGSQVADRLMARGKRVRALVRPTSQTGPLAAAGVDLATGDLLEPATLRSALDGVDAVVTSAAGYTRQHSKSNVSVQIRGLLEWQLVRQTRVAGSRRDHYEAATDFWRVMQAIVERRFRWNLRQVLATADETERALASDTQRLGGEIVEERLSVLRAYFLAVDALLGALSHGEPMTSTRMHAVATHVSPVQDPPKSHARPRRRRRSA